MFDSVDPKQSFPNLERAILAYWREEDAFRRSLKLREGRELFSFYDGPPFATGLPHYGHLLAGTIKDVIPRYQTMRGKYVPRRFGWDCHGLPVENLIEKEYGIKDKHAIEEMGVRRFNDLCRSSVVRYVKEWRATVERMGRWVDMDWDYRTMDPDYMESIWWVLQRLHEGELLYEGRKAMHICPRCVTPLSNFEVTQGYKDRTDTAVTWKFRLKDAKESKESNESKDSFPTYVLAWTTTPWSTLSTMGLSIKPDAAYVRVRFGNEIIIAAQERIDDVFKGKEGWKIIDELPGSALVGRSYEPIAPWYKELPDVSDNAHVYQIFAGDYVDPAEGTGIVTINGSYGEVDMEAAKRNKLPIVMDVDMTGHFTEDAGPYAGQYVKDGEKHLIADMEKKGFVWRTEQINHSYPHCWRCETPLLNYATSSWFVAVEKIKEDLLLANKETEWVPAHIRDGRFGRWLENARDWAISRSRYWGTPMPIWRLDKSYEPRATSYEPEMDVIGSRDELLLKCRLRFAKITTVRHGEAEHNAGGFYQSSVPGVPLTERGVSQADAAGAFLASGKIPVDIIYCSPLRRTRETAERIAAATGARVVVDDRLREVGAGSYEGKSIDFDNLTLIALRRKHKLQSEAPESVYHLEGMESWQEVYARVSSFFGDILPRHRSEHIVIVSHADPMLSSRHFFTKEDPFKLSHQPYPTYAAPESYFWDFDREEQMDLHKENIDDLVWPSPDAPGGVELILVRHGETDWNRKGLKQGGDVDPPLNETGREQAHSLAKQLKKSRKRFDGVVCAPLARASETAHIVAEALGIPLLEESTILRERMQGTWNGLTQEQFLSLFPHEKEIESGTFHYGTPENGESLSQFLRRSQKAALDLLRKHAGKRLLVITSRGMIRALLAFGNNLSYREALALDVKNAAPISASLRPVLRRIPDVLDCWFESGSMPFAQSHYPFSFESRALSDEQQKNSQLAARSSQLPSGFPADFIAEGIDQTRGWFYTLMVLSTALTKLPAFRHCVVNGIVLAEDGRKMSKRLKNYPEPTEVIERFGADALRFALMSSPAVRGEDLRFSARTVEETLRSVILPLWNSYSFFVTYANLARFEPVSKPRPSNHPLDRWIKAEVQDLVNRMTEQLDAYDLSATCGELFETIDALTNWYIRLSRRRFAGKGPSAADIPEAEPEHFEGDRREALATLYDVLLTVAQLLAPFCPFVPEAIYLNLVPEEHGSIHFTDWPEPRPLTEEEKELLRRNRLLRRIVSLGLKVRAARTIKIRTPLARATVAVPPGLLPAGGLTDADRALLMQELNVKEVTFTDDPGSLGEKFAQVDARKVGPRLGARVQEVIALGKRGDFTEQPDGMILIGDEALGPEEVTIVYRAREGSDIAAERGIVVSLDTTVSAMLQAEGTARDVIRAVQKLRKDAGLSLSDRITLSVDGIPEILDSFGDLIAEETNATLGKNAGEEHSMTMNGTAVTIRFQRS